MASVMEIKSEVFAGFYEGIDVLVLIRVEGIVFGTPQLSRVYWLALKHPKQDSE